jgi:TonB family protein
MGLGEKRNRAAIGLAVGLHGGLLVALVGFEIFDLTKLPVPTDRPVVSAIVHRPEGGGGGPSERRAPPSGEARLPKAPEARSRVKPKTASNPQETVTQPVEHTPSVDLEVGEQDTSEAPAVGSIPEPLVTSVVDFGAAGIGSGVGGGQGSGRGAGFGDGFGLGMAITDPVPLGDYSHFRIPQEDEQPGQIRLAIQLDARGVPAALRVTRSISPRLDQMAVDIARKFRFIPCRTYDGVDTPCAITWIFQVGGKRARNG